MFTLLLSLCILALTNPPTSALPTESKAHGVYASIPEAQRQGFRAATENLIALEKSGSWGDVYDRFYLNTDHTSKKQFIDKRDGLKVVAFVPKQIYYVPPSQSWFVSGCAVFSPPLARLGQTKGGFVSDFSAKRTTSGWRFDAPPAVTIFKDDPPSGAHPCVVGE